MCAAIARSSSFSAQSTGAVGGEPPRRELRSPAMRLQYLREEVQGGRQMRFPVTPVVSARVFHVRVRDSLGIEPGMERAIRRQQRVTQAAVEPERRQGPLRATKRLEYTTVLGRRVIALERFLDER